jgi:hypothetical protein
LLGRLEAFYFDWAQRQQFFTSSSGAAGFSAPDFEGELHG